MTNRYKSTLVGGPVCMYACGGAYTEEPTERPSNSFRAGSEAFAMAWMVGNTLINSRAFFCPTLRISVPGANVSAFGRGHSTRWGEMTGGVGWHGQTVEWHDRR